MGDENREPLAILGPDAADDACACGCCAATDTDEVRDDVAGADAQ